MATDTLDRERQLNNIIDRLVQLEGRVKKLEERLSAAIGTGGQLLVPEAQTSNLWALYVDDGIDGRPIIYMTRVK